MNTNHKITRRSLKSIEKITGGRLTLGKLIWAIRQSEEVTQVDFAKKLQISKQHLCDIEHDRKVVSPKLAAKYAKKLGYSEEQFVRLCLQDLVDREGLNVVIEVSSKRQKKSGKGEL